MGRRRSNILGDIYELGAMLPWWLTAPLALAAYIFLHGYADSDPTVVSDPGKPLEVLLPNIVRGVSVYAQYAVPGLLLAGALASALRSARRSQLFASILKKHAAYDLSTLTWRQFEDLTHELFRTQGYTVEQTQAGADGGIDLKLRKGKKAATVQCKHWRSRKVDVKTVREQLGVMTAAGADNCFVVTTGEYTQAARDFARGQPVILIDGDLLRMQLAAMGDNRGEEEPRVYGAGPLCPKCKGQMVRRTAKRGAHAGEQFWGCSRYPACRTILT